MVPLILIDLKESVAGLSFELEPVPLEVEGVLGVWGAVHVVPVVGKHWLLVDARIGELVRDGHELCAWDRVSLRRVFGHECGFGRLTHLNLITIEGDFRLAWLMVVRVVDDLKSQLLTLEGAEVHISGVFFARALAVIPGDSPLHRLSCLCSRRPVAWVRFRRNSLLHASSLFYLRAFVF